MQADPKTGDPDLDKRPVALDDWRSPKTLEDYHEEDFRDELEPEDLEELTRKVKAFREIANRYASSEFMSDEDRATLDRHLRRIHAIIHKTTT